MTSILVKHACIATVDGSNRILKDGALYTEDDRIGAVGRTEEVLKVASRPEFVIEGNGKAVLPGLVNTHVHLAQGLLRGLVPDTISLIEWLKDWVWPLQGNFKGEDGVVSSQLTILEMLNSGTTSFVATSVHTRYNPEAIAEVVLKSGIRAALGKQTMDVPGYAGHESILHPGMVEDKERSLKLFMDLYRKWNGKGGRVWIWLSPRTPGACSDDLYKELAEIKKEYNTGLTMHLAEVTDDIKYFRSRGTSPAKFVEGFGLVGPKTIYVHCVWFEDEDIEIFARTSTSVSHNPSSNAKLGSGIAPIVKMLNRGVNVALGTDGGPSNDSYDMIREMRLASLLQKVINLDPKAIDLLKVLRIATINGAKAMGVDHMIGSLEVDKKADFIVVDMKRAGLTPTINPLSNIIYSGTGRDVKDVVIDGQFVKKDWRVLTLNDEEVLKRAEERAETLLERAGKKPWL